MADPDYERAMAARPNDPDYERAMAARPNDPEQNRASFYINKIGKNGKVQLDADGKPIQVFDDASFQKAIAAYPGKLNAWKEEFKDILGRHSATVNAGTETQNYLSGPIHQAFSDYAAVPPAAGSLFGYGLARTTIPRAPIGAGPMARIIGMGGPAAEALLGPGVDWIAHRQQGPNPTERGKDITSAVGNAGLGEALGAIAGGGQQMMLTAPETYRNWRNRPQGGPNGGGPGPAAPVQNTLDLTGKTPTEASRDILAKLGVPAGKTLGENVSRIQGALPNADPAVKAAITASHADFQSGNLGESIAARLAKRGANSRLAVPITLGAATAATAGSAAFPETAEAATNAYEKNIAGPVSSLYNRNVPDPVRRALEYASSRPDFGYAGELPHSLKEGFLAEDRKLRAADEAAGQQRDEDQYQRTLDALRSQAPSEADVIGRLSRIPSSDVDAGHAAGGIANYASGGKAVSPALRFAHGQRYDDGGSIGQIGDIPDTNPTLPVGVREAQAAAAGERALNPAMAQLSPWGFRLARRFSSDQFDPNSYSFDIHGNPGDTPGKLTGYLHNDGKFYVGEVFGPSNDREIQDALNWGKPAFESAQNTMGPSAVRDILRQLKEYIPDIKGLHGFRVTGARQQSSLDALARGKDDLLNREADVPISRFQKAQGGAINRALAAARYDDGGGISGPLLGPTDGRADDIKTDVPNGSHILPADVVSSLGEGNSVSGAAKLSKIFPNSGAPKAPSIKMAMPRVPNMPKIPSMGQQSHPHILRNPAHLPHMPHMPGMPKGLKGGGKAHDHVPVQLSDGEYSIHPLDVARVGGGDIERGHRALNAWILHVRHADIERRKKLPGPA